jgi:hypothetical protein
MLGGDKTISSFPSFVSSKKLNRNGDNGDDDEDDDDDLMGRDSMRRRLKAQSSASSGLFNGHAQSIVHLDMVKRSSASTSSSANANSKSGGIGIGIAGRPDLHNIDKRVALTTLLDSNEKNPLRDQQKNNFMTSEEDDGKQPKVYDEAQTSSGMDRRKLSSASQFDGDDSIRCESGHIEDEDSGEDEDIHIDHAARHRLMSASGSRRRLRNGLGHSPNQATTASNSGHSLALSPTSAFKAAAPSSKDTQKGSGSTSGTPATTAGSLSMVMVSVARCGREISVTIC